MSGFDLLQLDKIKIKAHRNRTFYQLIQTFFLWFEIQKS